MGPISGADGHDGPRLLDELVPSLTAEVEDLVVGPEDLVGEPVFAQELPDVFHRVQLRGPWRQRQECDVGRDRELAGAMP